jgi:hypothetical protein
VKMGCYHHLASRINHQAILMILEVLSRTQQSPAVHSQNICKGYISAAWNVTRRDAFPWLGQFAGETARRPCVNNNRVLTADICLHLLGTSDQLLLSINRCSLIQQQSDTHEQPFQRQIAKAVILYYIAQVYNRFDCLSSAVSPCAVICG